MKRNIASLVACALLPLLLPACASSDGSSRTAGSGVKPYPLETCLVTGNELGSMGDVVVKTYGSQEVKFCCKPCVKKFEANPQKFLAKLP